MTNALKTVIKKITDPTLGYFYNQYPRLLEQEIADDCQTLLDIGCGANSPLQKFSKKLRWSVGVDSFSPSLEKSQANKIHDEYRLMDVLSVGGEFAPNSFDAVAALDLIEHLTKNDGYRLLEMMEKIAVKKVVVFTPNGFLPQGEYGNNPNQVHVSGWTAPEMRQLGFRVIGVNGWRPLRGEYSLIKRRPRWFWTPISWLSQLMAAKRPERAFQLLCVKEIMA